MDFTFQEMHSKILIIIVYETTSTLVASKNMPLFMNLFFEQTLVVCSVPDTVPGPGTQGEKAGFFILKVTTCCP